MQGDVVAPAAMFIIGIIAHMLMKQRGMFFQKYLCCQG